MSNHIHLLIREREDTVGMAIKRIASSYVYYYNRKYSRDGHLFRARDRDLQNTGTASASVSLPMPDAGRAFLWVKGKKLPEMSKNFI